MANIELIEPPLTEPPHIAGFCPEVPEAEPNKWIASGNQCFFFMMESDSTWLNAMEDCMHRDRRATLASIHHHPNNDVLFKLAHEKMGYFEKYPSVWIGMAKGKGQFSTCIKPTLYLTYNIVCTCVYKFITCK